MSGRETERRPDRREDSPPEGSGRTLRPYRAPRLMEYGCLTDVTRFGGSQIVDSSSGLGQAP